MVTAAQHPWYRSFMRTALAWRFRLFQQHRHRRLTVEHISGVPIIVLPDVFNPKLFHTGALLARHVHDVTHPGMRILDMGTGSGICAVFAARQGAQVVAVDITAEAVRCATINALLNGVEKRIEVRRGDLFAPVGDERFDLILFNPPFYTGRPAAAWEHAWRSEDAIERFAAGVAKALAEDGRALVILSTDAAGAMETFQRHNLRLDVVWQREYGNERLTIVEMRP